jgi:hypothetical protein
MIKLNDKMEQAIHLLQCTDNDLVLKKVDEFSTDVFPKIKLVDNQIVVVDYYNRVTDHMLNYEWITSTYKDFTGYEASCNKMRLSDYIHLEGISIWPFMMNLLDRLKRELREKYPQFGFTIIVQLQDVDTEIRFHVTRENEIGWLVDDLDQYRDDAILVCTI